MGGYKDCLSTTQATSTCTNGSEKQGDSVVWRTQEEQKNQIPTFLRAGQNVSV